MEKRDPPDGDACNMLGTPLRPCCWGEPATEDSGECAGDEEGVEDSEEGGEGMSRGALFPPVNLGLWLDRERGAAMPAPFAGRTGSCAEDDEPRC